MTTLSHDTTIRSHRSLLKIGDNEIDTQRRIYLAAYEALAKDPSDANWAKARKEFQKLMDIKMLYVQGRKTMNAFVCGKQVRR